MKKILLGIIAINLTFISANLALRSVEPANAQVCVFLKKQWKENGNQMCKYSDGTVLNVGAKTCPVSINC